MKRRIVLLLCLLMLLAGCSRNEPTSPQEIQNTLAAMVENNDKLEIMSNPAEGYMVSVKEDFLSLLNLTSWQLFDTEIAQTGITSMLYFDIPQAENTFYFTRVAIFSNGYSLIQSYTNEGFGEMNWYACPNGTAYYNMLSDYVFSAT